MGRGRSPSHWARMSGFVGEVSGGRSSVGRVQDCDSCRRGFESHRPPHTFLIRNQRLATHRNFRGHFVDTFWRKRLLQAAHFDLVLCSVHPLGVGAQKHLDRVAQLLRAKRWRHSGHQHRRRIRVTHVVRATITNA